MATTDKGGVLAAGKPEKLWERGFWRGPRSVRAFVRENRGFPLFYLLFFTAIFGVVIWEGVRRWYAFPIAVIAAAALTLVLVFLFSRGWLGNADGD
jgi:hypothetical protein